MGAKLRIDSSFTGMESARRYSSSTTRVGRYFVKEYGKNAADGMKHNFSGFYTGTGEETLESRSGRSTRSNSSGEENMTATLSDIRDRLMSTGSGRIGGRNRDSSLSDFRQKCMDYIFMLLFGEDKLNALRDGTSAGSDAGGENVQTDKAAAGQMLYYTNSVSFMEKEETAFSAKGIVKTADGREIPFNMDVSMTRSFASYYEENYGVAVLKTCDPLVINFDGDTADLTDQKYLFDIDGNGDQDSVSMPGEGSGYLALDKDCNGRIDDGNELFGPKTGNGFSDLAAYDEDGNGWIDENDTVWSKLKIWCKNADGTDSLYTLSEKGLGAICLKNSATDFELKGSKGAANGYIRSTGIFLYENGNVGTVQHVDVTQ